MSAETPDGTVELRVRIPEPAVTVEDGVSGMMGAVSTWEGRMSAKAAARRADRRAEKQAEREREWAKRSQPTEVDEAEIDRRAADMTPDDARAVRDARIGCACAGGPPGAHFCYCHLRDEAVARVLGQSCPWCERRRP